jgi:cell division septal protein FtsQ
VPRILDHPGLLAAPLVVVALLAGAYLWLRDSALVRVEHVTVVGASGPEAPRVRAALGDAARDMTTLHVRLRALRDAVRSFPTVRDLRVDRDLPHGLKVVILGRPVVAALSSAGARVAVAADGTLLRGSPVPRNVPAVRIAAPPAGARLSDPRAERALALVVAAPKAMRAHVARAFLGDQGLEADLRDGPAVIVGDGRRLRAKWVAAARVLGDPAARGARYVDVRVPERAVAGGLSEEEGQPSTTG